MNLRDLSYIVAVAEEGHFGRAAQRCHVSQPTLSGQIRKLEEELGVPIFERDSRNVSLTTVGETIVAEAREVVARARSIQDIARGYRDPLAGRIRLGIISSLSPFLTPDLLVQLGHVAPKLEVSLTEDLTQNLLAALRARDLDAIIIATEPDGADLAGLPIFDEPFLIGHAPTDPLAGKKVLTIEDLRHATLLLLEEGHCLRDQALSLCRTEGVDRTLGASSLLTVMRLAAAGRGITLVPALAAGWAKGLVLRELKDPLAHRHVQLVARRKFAGWRMLHVVANAAREAALAIGTQS